MTTKSFCQSIYIIACLILYIFILVNLGSYEDHYRMANGSWYSKESMNTYQYLAYLLTYMLSFPIGLPFMLRMPGLFAEHWILFSVINVLL